MGQSRMNSSQSSPISHPEFPLAPDLVYLNHAAVAPWPQRTVQAVSQFAVENGRYGAASYPNWLKTEARLREQFRQLLNAPSTDDIALVKNTSEAISMVAFGLRWQPGDNIVSSNEEFPSNRIPWQVQAQRNVEFREADLRRGRTPEEALFEKVDRRTRLIAVSSVQFGTGLRLDLERIGQFCRNQGILFAVDAIQSLGALRFDVQACGADFVMADGHKWLLGPEGLGVFYTSPQGREALDLTQYGWHMVEQAGNYDDKTWEIAHDARRFECGSPNMLGIHALSASLSLLLETGMETVEQQVLDRTRYLVESILERNTLSLMSSPEEARRSGIVLFHPKHGPSVELFAHLKARGIICALRAGGIRLSPHFYTPHAHLEQTMDSLDHFRHSPS
jgi:cysteine desulfurase/selenocysteine lyase